MTIFKNLEDDIVGDDYCGLYTIRNDKNYVIVNDEKVPLNFFKMPDVGDKYIFIVQKSRKDRYKKYPGEVIDKYGEDHILVRNLKNGFRESYFKVDFITKEVLLKAI